MNSSFKSVMCNAIESWRVELSKECIAHRVAGHYHKLGLGHEVDAQRKELLKVPGKDDKNNAQNFFRYVERSSIEAKATMLDLLPAVLLAMPAHRATDMLNQAFNPLGFSITRIGASDTTANRDKLLHDHNKETSEAFRAVISLAENTTIDQLRSAYREVQEAKDSHTPIMKYLESLMAQKAA